MNARVRLPASLGGGIVELSAEQQAQLDEWAAEARTDDLAGRVGGEKRPGGRHVRVPPEPPFDPGSKPCRICGLRVGEGRIAWEQSVSGARPHGSNKWEKRHRRAMQRGEVSWEHCEASRAADRAYTAATRAV